MIPETIPFSSIIPGDRYRKDYGDLSGLKESLVRHGSIHSIVLSRREELVEHERDSMSSYTREVYDLIAGGRRYAAMKELGVTVLHHNVIITPGTFSFCFQNEVPEDVRKELELDENLYSLRTSWIEEVLAISDIHIFKRRQQKEGLWGQAQTAKLLGAGFNNTNVNYALRVAKCVRAGDEEILACPHLKAAIGVLVKRKEDDALAEVTKRATAKVAARNIEEPKAGLEITQEGKPVAIHTDLSPDSFTSAKSSIEIPLSSMFFLGDTLSLPWPEVDHIVTDIPYGIDMDNLDADLVVDVKDTHDVAQNVSMMPQFLAKAYASLRPGGFCVFFYDLDHHEKLQGWARRAGNKCLDKSRAQPEDIADVGFRVQRWPFIACKTSSCRNQAAQYNTTKNFEVAMFLRKENATLRRAVSTSWKTYDFAEDRRVYNNPFAKPFALWNDIYNMIAFTGQSVLDPYSGERSACLAAIKSGLVPYGIELSPQHFNRGDYHVRELYTSIHKGEVEFT